MNTRPTGRDSDKFMLRLPDGMRERIKRVADQNKRSMNSEIVEALDRAFPEEPSIDEVAEDIKASIKIVRTFGGKTLLGLADDLDRLILDLSQSSDADPAKREAASAHIKERGKFFRFLPPDEG